MATPVAPPAPDTTPPSAPGTLTATAISSGRVDLSWGAATDNVAVTGYHIERCQGAGCTSFAEIATPPAAPPLQRHQHRRRHQLQLPRPRQRRRPQPRPLLQHRHGGDPQSRHDAALGAGHVDRDRDQQRPGRSQLGRGHRQRRRDRLPHRALPGAGCTSFAEIGTTAGSATTYSDTSTAAGTSYSYRVRANDAVPNLGPYSNTATAITPVPSGPTPVAAFSFDEGSGSTVADASGNGNNGTVANTTWAAAGKYGKALSFNGTSSRVTVPNAASLQLSAGMTLEAWVNPATTTAAWRDVIYKGNDNYYLMGTTDHSGVPAGGGTFAGANANAFAASALATNSWTYLATTYDGANLRLYVNGTLAATQAKTGAITSSTNPLTIGSDPIWGQYFNGLIDDVRIYNTALTASQIQTDMTTPVGGPRPVCAGHVDRDRGRQ